MAYELNAFRRAVRTLHVEVRRAERRDELVAFSLPLSHDEDERSLTLG
jgi:hypothetical protein